MRSSSSRVFQSIDMSAETFESPAHTRIKRIQDLLATGQVDRHLFWVDPFTATRADASGASDPAA